MDLEKFKEMFFCYNGRLNRKPYIIRYLIVLVLIFLNEMLLGAPRGVMNSNLLYYVLTLVFAASILMLDIRRLHDLGRSGWWVLLMFIPIANLALLIYLFFFKGNEFSNEYGENPLENLE